MLLIVERGIKSGICHAVYQYVKDNNKYMKDYDKNKESKYLKYSDVNYWYGWKMLLMTLNRLEALKNLKFEKRFRKIYNEESDVGYFLEVDVQYSENLHNFRMIYPFCLNE